jgi:hypothetical protein
MYYALIREWFDRYVKRIVPAEETSTEEAGITAEPVPVQP